MRKMKRGQYRCGEKPAIGDTVRMWSDAPGCSHPVGLVDTVHDLDSYGDPVLSSEKFKDFGYNGERFELIARAGEPVIFQPGDVVELVASHAVLTPGRYTTVNRQIGFRYTLCDPAYAPNGSGSLHYVDNYNGGYKTWAPPSYFKLVHRPDPVKQGDPVDPPFGCNPLKFEPPEPQVGDRVRVTFEAELGGAGQYQLDNPGEMRASSIDYARRMWDAKVEIVARPEKPLAVGDIVRSTVAAHTRGEIVAIHSDTALLLINPRNYAVRPLHTLERVR